ncbi:MAG: hypothetical protein MJ137_04125 [Clostridia bacterium]|nr:hypothetical protein [Clostridia bacterium]
MTKRALAVIALLFVIPVIAGLVFFVKWKNRNPVVAKYVESVNVIEYRGETYRLVEGSEDFCFELGAYVGKVGERLTGAPLYLVKNDETGEYLAVSGNDGIVLFTVTGKLADGAEKENSRITAVSFNNFAQKCTDKAMLSQLSDIMSSEVNYTFVPDEWKVKNEKAVTDISEGFSVTGIKKWRVDICFDGSAVASKRAGYILKIEKKNIWLFVSEAAVNRCGEALENGEITSREYGAVKHESISDIRLFRSIFEPSPETEGVITEEN